MNQQVALKTSILQDLFLNIFIKLPIAKIAKRLLMAGKTDWWTGDINNIVIVYISPQE